MYRVLYSFIFVSLIGDCDHLSRAPAEQKKTMEDSNCVVVVVVVVAAAAAVETVAGMSIVAIGAKKIVS